jgi:hypothetical protein
LEQWAKDLTYSHAPEQNFWERELPGESTFVPRAKIHGVGPNNAR